MYSQLDDVGAIRIHPVEVGHDVPVAHAVFGLPGRTENDLVIREIERINIGHSRGKGKLLQVAAICVNFIDVVVILQVFPVGEEDPVALEGNFRIPDHSGLCFQQGSDFP
jgi:hypothetical protein